MSLLGDKLREQREKRGWSQKFTAQKLGMKNSSTYSNWEYGIRDPDTETLVKLAALFEVTTDYLTGRSEVKLQQVKNESLEILEQLTKNDWVHNGEPLPDELIDEIRTYVRIRMATDK